MAQITVDPTACTRCGGCVDVCSIAGVFEMTEEGVLIQRPDDCWHCGHCVAVCPADAIDHEAFPLEDCPMISASDRPSLVSLLAEFRMRRSQRVFLDQSVSREEIRELVSYGRWAPTASNSQSVDWIAIDDPSRIQTLSEVTVAEIARFSRMANVPPVRWLLPLAIGQQAARQLKRMPALAVRLQRLLDRGDDPVFYRAPVVLFGHCPSSHLLARDDTVYAAYNIMLAASSLGLGTCQIGFFQLVAERRRQLARQVGLPRERSLQVVLAVGYPRREFRRAIPRRSPNLVWNVR